MRHQFALLVLAVSAAACNDAGSPAAPLAPAPAALSVAPAGEVIPNQYIVVFKDQVHDAGVVARTKVGRGGGALRHSYSAAIKGFSAVLSPAAVAALRSDPDVAYIEPDQVMHASTTQTGATWGLDRIDQRALPLSTTYSYTATGSGVTAYIIDTGIEITHPELGGRASVGFDAVGDGRNGIDCNGHGTHVSGTTGGKTYGVAKSVTLVAVRVLDCNGSGTTSGVIAGVDWVTSHHVSPSVANMSLGGGASTTLDNAVKNSIARGVTYAVAAGNGNILGMAQDACRTSPARVPEAITVGATDKTDTKASWSNYGNCVDFFAPGVGITSSWLNGGTNTISGTSMATPHVTGVAALYLQGNRGASPQIVRDALFAATTKGVVKSSRTTNNHLLFTNY
jgi:subtilisin family serine protease